MYIPYIDLEIKLVILTKKGRIVRDLKEHGKIYAVKQYMMRYKCGLGTALNYINTLEGELNNVKGHKIHSATIDEFHEPQKPNRWLWRHH